jgi:allantoin racemase
VATVLAINPNTTEAVTALLGKHLAAAAPATNWRTAGGRFGASYIISEAAYAVASHAAIDAWASDTGPADAVLLACFGDPGLFALRELCPVPVVGMAEASMRAAGGRFSIVTGGPRWSPMLERLAHALGFGDALARVRTTEVTGGEAAADPDRAIAALAAACRQARNEDGAASVILGGAGFAGLAQRVSEAAGVDVIDGVSAAALAAERLALGAPCPYGRIAPSKRMPSSGLSNALADKLLD